MRVGVAGVLVLAIGFPSVGAAVGSQQPSPHGSTVVPSHASPPVTIWTTSSLENVFRDTPLPPRPTRAVSLLAAGGEYESAQIVLAPREDVAAASATVTDLVGPGGRITRRRVQCRFVGYVWLDGSYANSPTYGLARPFPAWYPDPLLDEESVPLRAGENQPLLVTVSVPMNQPEGCYAGTVRLKLGEAALNVPIAVEVLPFSVPRKPSLSVTNWFNIEGLATNADVPPFSEQHWRLVEALAREMAEHRQTVVMVPFSLISVVAEPDGSLTYDFERFDRFVRTFIRAGAAQRLELSGMGTRIDGWAGRYVLVPHPATERATGKAASIEPERFLPPLVRHLKEKGWYKRCIIHVGDEPQPATVGTWRQAAERIRAAVPDVPRVEALCLPGIPNDCEIWAPCLDFYETRGDEMREAHARGDCEELWFYTCWNPQGSYPNRFISYPLVSTRVLHWANFLTGTTGYLHWGLNQWGCDPKELPDGDPWILYPSTRGFRGSLRWEAMRDGLEDYEYFKLLAARKGQARAMQLCRRLMRKLSDFDRDPRKMLAIRQTMAREIAG